MAATLCMRTGILSLILFVVIAPPHLGLQEATAQERLQVRVEEQGSSADLQRAFEALDPTRIPTGLLHDQVVSFAHPARFDGSRHAEAASLDDWRQVYHEFSRSGVGTARRRGEGVAPFLPLDAINRTAGRYLDQGLVPLAVLSVAYNTVKEDALGRGLLRMQNGHLYDRQHSAAPYERRQAFMVAAYKARSPHQTVRFVIPPEFYFTAGQSERPPRLEVDFGDGAGWRSVQLGEVVTVAYESGGAKEIELAVYENGQPRYATSTFVVSSVAIPEPDRTWLNQQAKRAYAGGKASYDVYAFYGDGNTRLTRPVVFVESFDVYYNDPAKRRTWQDIYELLAEEDFLATLLAHGHDAVIFKLHNATDYVQRNAFALVDLLDLLGGELRGEETLITGCPSMGGLICRYALAYMERKNLSHRVSKYISIDAPHRGANVPLGDQFSFAFFAGDSEKAREGRDAVNTPAARQMLIYQYRAVPREDPLRTALKKELRALGYPKGVEKIALASGSGHALAQLGNERVGFRRMQPGDKIVEYRYRSFWVDLDGDVWAVPDEDDPTTQIFEGRVDFIGPHRRVLNVYISGTQPYDNAPGGSRGTQGEIASVDPPRGRMYTSFPDHDWIPTVSALDLETPGPFYNVHTDPDDLITEEPGGHRSTAIYASIYYPVENEQHVDPTPENVRFLLHAIDPSIEAVPALASVATGKPEGEAESLLSTSVLPTQYALDANYPNPFGLATEIHFALPEAGTVSLEIYDVLGRRVAQLVDGPMPAGRHRVTWEPRGHANGLYLYRLVTDSFVETRRMLLVR